jgi:hypothetical protein
MNELKKKYFEHVLSLKGRELLVPLNSLLALDYIICERSPLKGEDEDCGEIAPCIEKGWEDELAEKYMVKIKIVDFIKNEEGD